MAAVALEELVGDDDRLDQRRAARRHVALAAWRSSPASSARPPPRPSRSTRCGRSVPRCRDSRGTAGRPGRPSPARCRRSRANSSCLPEIVTPVTRMPRRAAVSAKPPQPQPISRMLSPCLAPIWSRMRSYLAVCAASSGLRRAPSIQRRGVGHRSDRATGRRTRCRGRSGHGCSSLRALARVVAAADASASAAGRGTGWCAPCAPNAFSFSARSAINPGRSDESQKPSM